MSKYSEYHPIVFLICLPFLVLNGISKFFAKIIFFPLKSPITDFLGLKRFSWHWKKYSLLFRLLRLFAGLYFSAILIILFIVPFSSVLDKFFPFSMLFGYIGFAVIFGIPVAIVCWVEEYGICPEIQKKLSGDKAEAYVQQIIENNRSQLNLEWSFHGKLLVFNKNLSNEFSVELDHILISRKNIYFIETKRKSGEIHFDANNDEWIVKTKHGQSSMRNALKQIRNSAKVIQDHLDLPYKIIPIVAIVGENSSIISAPGNVVLVDNLFEVLKAFESDEITDQIDIGAVVETMRSHFSEDKKDFEKHISRANSAREKLSERKIVTSSCI